MSFYLLLMYAQLMEQPLAFSSHSVKILWRSWVNTFAIVERIRAVVGHVGSGVRLSWQCDTLGLGFNPARNPIVFNNKQGASVFSNTAMLLSVLARTGRLSRSWSSQEKKLYWRLFALQCCVNFWCTSKWINYTYMYISLFGTTEQWVVYLCYTVGPH